LVELRIIVNDYAVGLPSEYLPASIYHVQNTNLAGAEDVMLSMLDDPPRVFKRKQVKIVEKGQGKQSSVELNLLYRVRVSLPSSQHIRYVFTFPRTVALHDLSPQRRMDGGSV
jgi:hypothetical protein